MAAPSNTHLFGIRHHGPGCARSLLKALEELAPDVILIEGPPDAEGLLGLAGQEGMTPPVALLAYAVEDPKDGGFFPFAEFSPEWQAIQYGLKKSVPVHFIDLPQTHQVALRKERLKAMQEALAERTMEEAAGQEQEDRTDDPDEPSEPEEGEKEELQHRAPLGWLGRAAGYEDGEEWWEHTVEQRSDGQELFAAIAEAMTALRADAPPLHDPFEARREALREAHMRKCIRVEQKAGRERIAVVCGAWHVPALASMPSAGSDNDLLKGLPKAKIEVVWIPWTYQRLATESGYGAGVTSPAWYEHLWKRNDGAGLTVTSWFTRVARLLRQVDLDCSSAHVIECVRLADTLAALRDRPLPGLNDLMESARAILSMGDDTALRMIRRDLIIGQCMGQVPPDAPMVPLHRDLERQQKSLRLKVSATQDALDLDLRKENDLARSVLLHRLRLLTVPWGQVTEARSGKGTFREVWKLQWQPEFALSIIEASVSGNTVVEAAAARAGQRASEAEGLPELTELIEQVLLADLPQALQTAMQELNNRAALTGDVPQLIAAVPPLAQVSRYGNVRQTDVSQVLHVLDGLVARVCIGLSSAAQSLDEDAAEHLSKQIKAMHTAVALVDKEEHRNLWQGALRQLSEASGAHPLLCGHAVRLLLDDQACGTDDVSRHMSQALSRGTAPEAAAAWLQGFLTGGGMVLIHDDALFRLLDDWMSHLSPDHFTQILPLIRRSFSTFPTMERRQIGERVKRSGHAAPAPSAEAAQAWDSTRAAAVVPVLKLILGLMQQEANT